MMLRFFVICIFAFAVAVVVVVLAFIPGVKLP